MDINIIKNIDYHIINNTGNAAKIAKQMGITERCVYKYIKYMIVDLQAPIIYDRIHKRYIYLQKGKLIIKYIIE